MNQRDECASEKKTPLTVKEKRRAWRRAILRRWLLPTISRPMTASPESALVVAPHQDDETFGCGGLIALKRHQNAVVTVVFVTDGSRYQGEVSGDEKARVIATRQAEARAACAALGVPPGDVLFLGFPDGDLPSLSDALRARLLQEIRHLLDDRQPGELYLPHRRDTHPDHEATYRIFRTAVEARPVEDAPIVYEYPVWLLWSRTRFPTDLRPGDLAHAGRLNIRPALAHKEAAVREYHSQLATLPAGFAETFLSGDEYFFHATFGKRPDRESASITRR